MAYRDRLIQVKAKSEMRFAELIGEPITFDQAIEKAKEKLAGIEKLAEKEQNETVIDLSTGKRYKRNQLHS